MEPLGNPSQLSNVEVNLKFLQNYLVCGAGGCPGVSMLTFYSDDLSSNPTDAYYFCLWPTAEGPSNYLSCSCSRHFINLLLGCTSGLNLAADLGPVLALLLCKNCLTRTKKRPVLANLFMKISHLLTLPLRPRLCDFKKSFRHSFSGESVSSKKFPSRPFRTLTLLGEKSSTVSKMTTQLCLVELGHLLAEGLKIGQVKTRSD